MSLYPEDVLTIRDGFQGREIQVYGKTPAEFCGLTTNKMDYVQHQLEARPAPVARQAAGNLPFDGQSTYAAEYPAHPMQERHIHSGYEYKPSPAAFDGTTTYKTNFVPHAMERNNGTGRIPAERVSLPFDGTTSYRQDYPVHALPERAVHTGGPYMPAHVPFDGASTYKGDFVQHAFEPRPAVNQAGTARPSLPFEGSTTYGEYFRPYPVQPHAAGGPRAGQFRPSNAKFEGTTESMDKYRAWAMDPSNRRGGGPPPMRPSLPFDGTTTNREMFQGWQLPPRRPALGVQMVGDSAYVLLPANAPVPAVGRQVFTTVHDGQCEMRILVLEGDFSQASRCNVLGHFDLTNLPVAPKGQLQVEVTFQIDANGVLNVTACDLNTHRQEQWLREGYLVAHVNHEQQP